MIKHEEEEMIEMTIIDGIWDRIPCFFMTDLELRAYKSVLSPLIVYLNFFHDGDPKVGARLPKGFSLVCGNTTIVPQTCYANGCIKAKVLLLQRCHRWLNQNEPTIAFLSYDGCLFNHADIMAMHTSGESITDTLPKHEAHFFVEDYMKDLHFLHENNSNCSFVPTYGYYFRRAISYNNNILVSMTAEVDWGVWYTNSPEECPKQAYINTISAFEKLDRDGIDLQRLLFEFDEFRSVPRTFHDLDCFVQSCIIPNC